MKESIFMDFIKHWSNKGTSSFSSFLFFPEVLGQKYSIKASNFVLIRPVKVNG